MCTHISCPAQFGERVPVLEGEPGETTRNTQILTNEKKKKKRREKEAEGKEKEKER